MPFAVLDGIEMNYDRSTAIGGSDIASILGVSPWKSAYELWEEKVFGTQQESSEGRDKVLRRGKKLEPMVIEMLQEERDVWIVDRNQVYTDSEHAFLRCEIDFEYVIPKTSIPDCGDYVAGNGDVKTVSPFMAKDWGEEGTDEFPVYYCAQFQFGLMITGRSVCMVAALIGADDLRVYEVKRDEELIAYIREAAIKFWNNHVLAKVPPPIQTSDDASKMMSRFAGLTVEAPPEVREAITRIKGIKAAEKRLEAKRDVLELEVKKSLVQKVVDTGVEGDPDKFAFVGENGKPLLTWNNQTVNRLSQKRIQAEFPEAYEKCVEASTYRVMRIK